MGTSLLRSAEYDNLATTSKEAEGHETTFTQDAAPYSAALEVGEVVELH